MEKMKLLLFVIMCNLFYSQTNNVENIRKGILKENSYEDLEGEFYNNNNRDINIKKKIAKYYLQKAKSENNKTYIAEGYVMLHFDETLPNALKYLDSLQVITKNSKENFYPARTYLLRGNLYFKSDNLQSALNNYVLGLKYAKKKRNKRQIAIADVSIAYLNNYIGKHRETAKTLNYYLYNADYLNDDERNNLKLNLADAYIEINKMDSAYVLIQDGLQYSKKNNDSYLYYQNLSLMGYYDLKLKKYKESIENLQNCKKYFFSTNDSSRRDQNYTLLNLGKAYAGIHEIDKAIENFAKIDSMVIKTDYVFPELRDVYTYLIDYYKKINDKEKQLYYVERFLKVDHILDSQFRYISRELPRRYDTPKLLQEKEDITNELQNKKTFFYISVCILIIVLLLFINMYIRYKKAEKKHRKIAQDLIESVSENKIKKETELKGKLLNNDLMKKSIGILNDKTNKSVSEDVAQSILKELDIFEAKYHFINTGITLGSLAKKIKTNSKYLSEIINTSKGKNFAGYLNDLRIDYAINRLATDRKFRAYKIPFIAEELGYNNEQAFTLAFKKRTGTTLSIYLKEIETREGKNI
ncbi:helix-turn-helix domain-containing protein [uncultured Chryseobacterium sp.]|uniref:helix-turn-helix domain-containing protein n=1 Tax=uncultured Chryseobacterium sp. TaxID=259322 RepID=UPI0025F2EB09|nr:helix-turn-helix domain-containing protein [uncultured Chryseobacterium sp.]